ncbi:MAG: PKD domain-containing protein [Candidatus Gracilibacteria bacterium]|nr:PKD domain-containing protein [Candidatus Gracilibacteria bacterium]
MSFGFYKEDNACKGQTAYIISRKDNIVFSGKESIDTNGKNTGLSYSWLVGQGKYKTGQSINERFDELGCYRVKLTVKSEREKSTSFSDIWVKVKNMNPTISGLKISAVNLETDPVIVTVSALGTKDPDGVIQSYLWYYTTDIDNEAQDFRITKTPSTAFVIPKIQGTYYFGVMLKDNNGAKVNSEDLINKIGNNFIELQGDNSNTPLIDFTTSDSSVSIGEEVSFRAIAKNIRGDSIEKTAKFSWDFDGDGFYDEESDKGTITHKYKKSGTFYPKVKVRNKGFSNTRTLTMSVSNKLVSDFKYISIGNKFIFVDTSKGTIDKNSWDLGDGTKQEDREKFIHKYNDKESTHFVELTVAEGTKVKKITKEVEKDLRNLIKTRKTGLNVFTFPALSSNGTIILLEEDDIFIYLGESKGNFQFYGIDYDIDNDSDINGGADDDIDNIKNSSYKTGSPEKIILNNQREQTIRLFLLDEEGNTIDSKDIQIIKEYIEEEKELIIGEFNGVTDKEKAKIEDLKISLSKLPQKDRMKAMQFLNKLQESWGDETEKVRTIISFEEFIYSTGYENSDNIIDLLESLISEDNSDERTVAFEALKALIPNDIQCSVETGTCKESLIIKLEQIKNSTNIEENKKIGADFGIIGKDKNMTVKQKTDFKGILQILIYGGINTIPQDIVDDQGKDDKEISGTEESSEESELGGFLKNVGWWIAGIVGVIIFLMLIFWILDFLKNRKNGESFEDFVDNKTGDEDILGDFSDPLDEKKEEINPNPLSGAKEEEKQTIIPNKEISFSKTKEIKEENIDPLSEVKEEETTEDIPDWLSGNVEETKVEEEVETEIKEENKKQEEDFGFSLDVPKEEKVEEKVEENPNPLSGSKEEETTEIKKEENLDFDIEKETSIEEEEDNTPDWLKDSLTEKLPERKEENSEVLSEAKEDIEEIKKESEIEPVIIEDKKKKN